MQPSRSRICPPPFFFFNDTATTEIYTLSLHDALPIYVPENEHYPKPFPCICQNRRRTVFNVEFLALLRQQNCMVGQTDDLPFAEDFLDRVFDRAAKTL